MSNIKTTNPQRNTFGFLSFIFGIVSMFFYQISFFIPEVLAIVFGIIGIIESKKILNGKKIQPIIGIILGVIYALMLLINILNLSTQGT